MDERSGFRNKLKSWLLAIGPGIMAIGYTVGTGSVTSMIVAGSSYGMTLLWVLLLSCLFSGILLEAYGRFAVVTGSTALYSFRKHFKWGKPMGLLILAGVTFAQWNSLIGILGISSNVIFETLTLFIPQLAANEYAVVLILAVVIIIVMNLFLWVGKYQFFEKILVIFVSFMAFSFIFSLFIVLPPPEEILEGLVPRIPQVEGGRLLTAAFVGTTMAAPTFISRPLFIRGKGWDIKELSHQRKDAVMAAIWLFIINASIMAVAMGSMFFQGKSVDKALDMVYALEPIAGKLAISVFLLGTLSAGLSSIFPILMIAPLLIADYQSGQLDLRSTRFRVLVVIASVIGLLVPVLGADAVQAQIVTQIFSVFVLPLVIWGILILINRSSVMGVHRAGWGLNLGIGAALLFSLYMSYQGIVAIVGHFN